MLKRISVSLVLVLAAASRADAQDSTMRTDHPPRTSAKPSWISRRDLKPVGIGVASLTLLSLTDEKIANAVLRPGVQSNNFLNRSADFIQTVGDPGALLISTSLYLAGRVSRRPGLTDASRHAIESLALSAAVTHSLKFLVGRARPNLSAGDNAYAFQSFHGNRTDHNSFPSGHTSAAFATASAFGAELSRLHPRAGRVAKPLLYGVATLVGGARMYNNRHWLSDVAAGALIGEFTARRVLRRAHESPH